MSNRDRIIANNITLQNNQSKLGAILTKIQQIPTPLDTSDATATADDIKKDKIAYVDGNKITGTHEEFVPTGTIDITENGTVDVTNYANANVNVQGGGGESPYDYFNSNLPNYKGSNNYNGAMKLIKKIPVGLQLTGDCSYMFTRCSFLHSSIISNAQFDTSNVTNMSYMFNSCTGSGYWDELDLTSWRTEKVTTTTYMFSGCTTLQKLNIKNFNPVKMTSFTNMFGGIPNTCEITTNQTMANWMATNFSKYTNIKIVKADWEV